MIWWEAGLRLVAAAVIGCIIGLEREHKHRPAGMRTHVLVCLGAAMITVLEGYIAADVASSGAANVSFTAGRLAAQVISGIGFLGAGTIFMSQKRITGLTTAASVWNAACLGLAAGMGYYWLALAGAAIVLLTLAVLRRAVRVSPLKCLEIRYIHRVETQEFIGRYLQECNVTVIDIDFHAEASEEGNVYTNVYTLSMPNWKSYTDIITRLSEHANIRGIRTLTH